MGRALKGSDRIPTIHCRLGGGFNLFFISTTTLGNDPIFAHIFQVGWFNHQPVGDFVGHSMARVDWLKIGGWYSRVWSSRWEADQWEVDMGIEKALLV